MNRPAANDVDNVAPFQKVGAVAQTLSQRWPLEARVQEMLRDPEALVVAFRRHVGGAVPTLTDREKDVLEFIRAYRKLHQVSPTLQKIAVGVRLGSKGRAHTLVCQLEEKGLLVRKPGRRQSIALVERAS